MPSRNVIEILIQATDAASDAIEGSSKKITSVLDSVGSGLVKTGGVLTALGAPFLGFAATAIKSAMDSEDAIAQLNATLKSTKGAAGVTEEAALNLASSLQKITTYGDEAILSGESLLLTFTNVGSGVFARATKAALDMSTAMKQDLKGSVIQLGKSLNDPINGLTALTRVGVTFTEAQKEQVRVLQESGDIMGAQGIILAELEKEFGGSAEAAGKTFAGSLVILQNRFDDVMETIGQGLIPIVQQVTAKLSDLVTWFENLDEPTRQTIVTIVAIGAALAVIGPIIAAIGIGISALGAVIGVVFSPIGIAIGLVVAALLWLANHFGITVGQLQVYGSLIKLYAEYYFQGVVTAIQKVWTDVEPELQKLYDWFLTTGLPFINSALDSFRLNFLTPASNAISSIWTTVQPALNDLSKWFVTDGLPGMGTSLTTFKNSGVMPVVNLLQTIWGMVSPALQKFSDWFSGDKGGMKQSQSSVLDFIHILEWLSDAIRTVMDLSTKLVGGVVDAATSVLNQGNPGGATQAQNMAQNFMQSATENGFMSAYTGGSRGFSGPAPLPLTSSGVQPGYLPGSYNNDAGFHISGPITVVANNPDEFRARLQQLKRTSG